MTSRTIESVNDDPQCVEQLDAFHRAYRDELPTMVGRLSIEASLIDQLDALIDPASDSYLPRQPYFTATWLNVLAWGRRPAG